jgi:hypothetical protein
VKIRKLNIDEVCIGVSARVHVLVIRLAELNAKSVANLSNAHPSLTGGVKFETSSAPRPPLAELVSNPTPPGQILREWV